MPSAPPSSAAVSEIPDAAPAFSAGAEPTTSSVVSPNTGPMPSEITTDATPRARRSPVVDAPTWVSTNSPTAATASPPATSVRRRDPARAAAARAAS